MMTRLIIIGLIIAAISGAILRWQYVEKELDRVNYELKTSNKTIDALDDVSIKNNELYIKERTAVDEIEKAPLSDDGPVAPVLMRTINRIDSLRHTESE